VLVVLNLLAFATYLDMRFWRDGDHTFWEVLKGDPSRVVWRSATDVLKTMDVTIEKKSPAQRNDKA
jgi:hypothetical protein